jgi:hypothetical protein
MGLEQINRFHNHGIDYVQALLGASSPSNPSSLNDALRLELNTLVKLGKLSDDQASATQNALSGIDLLSSFTTPDKFGDLISALSNSGVVDFVVDGGSVQITDPLAAALVDAGMLQALPQANLIIDATNSGDHLFTSLKAMAELGIDAVHVAANSKFYVDLGLPTDDQNAIADIKAILASLDPANSAKPIFDQGQGVLVMNNSIANIIHESGGLSSDLVEALQKLGINEIDVLADSAQNGQTNIIQISSNSGPVLQTPVMPVEVKVIGMAEDPALHDHLQPHIPVK